MDEEVVEQDHLNRAEWKMDNINLGIYEAVRRSKSGQKSTQLSDNLSVVSAERYALCHVRFPPSCCYSLCLLEIIPLGSCKTVLLPRQAKNKV